MAEKDLEGLSEIIEGIRYLTVDALIFINQELIRLQTPDEPVKLLKPTELSSSQQRPAHYRWYLQCEDVFCLASVLMESLVRNHPFANANKRTAAMAGTLFLMLNGQELTGPGHELVTLLVGIAEKEYTRDEVEDWLAYWSRPLDAAQLNNRGAWQEMFSDCRRLGS